MRLHAEIVRLQKVISTRTARPPYAMPAFGQNSLSRLDSMVDLEEKVAGQASMNENTEGTCRDTPGWENSNGYGCAYYQAHWCANGTAKPGMQGTLGPAWNFPEANCCACGKVPDCVGHCQGKCEMPKDAFTAQCKLTDRYWNFQSGKAHHKCHDHRVIQQVGTKKGGPKWSIYGNKDLFNPCKQVLLGRHAHACARAQCTHAHARMHARRTHVRTQTSACKRVRVRRQRLLPVRRKWQGAG